MEKIELPKPTLINTGILANSEVKKLILKRFNSQK